MLNRGFSLSKRIKTIDIAKVFTCLAMATTVSLIPAYGQQIITDGNTNTTLNVNGNVTGVYTNTIKGQNAFNSFERFNVNKGNVVNLYVPEKTNNLINLVNSETSYIDGLLNSIKIGKIGGNIFIANPYGVVVGSNGAINVGSLTVTTPTADYMNSFFNSPGKPNQPAVNALLNGTAPINPDGVINIEGKINAIENVTLDTGNFYNSGDIYSGAVFQENDINIGDVVNINTLESGAEIAVNNGQISIKASNNIVNSGNIVADGGNNIDGGSVSAVAGNNVVLERGSLISAKGKGENSNGGYIYTWGDNGNYFNDGATLDARPGETSGAGGFIEVSTRGGLTFKGEVFTGRYNRRGSLLIDPKNITISSSAGSTIADNDQFNENSSSSVIINNSDLVNLLDNPNNVILQANNDITVSNDIIVNNPSGDGGDLTLQAGRSVYINADIIMDNGDFVVIANETTANGVVDAQREYGNGVINMGDGTSIDAGTGNISLSITNDIGKTYYGTGNISLKTIDANNITIDNDGPNTSSGVILSSSDTITAAGNLTIYSNASIIDGTDDGGATLIGNNISLTALYGIGSSTSNYLEIDSGASSSEVVYARATDSTYGKIYISETIDDLNLNYIWAGNDIALKADDNIIDSRVSGTGNVFGKNITLISTNGNIGESSSDPLKIELNYQTTGGVLLATATNSTNGNIYIENTDTAAANKALELNYAWAKNDVYLKADDNIIDSRVSGTGNVFGKNITLTSTNGNIGESSSDPLLIDTNYQTSGGELTASASGDIYLKETSGDLNIEYAFSNGNDVYIIADDNILDTRGNTDKSYPNVWGNNITLTSTNGAIGASGTDNDLDLYLNYNSSGGELTASAAGDIYLDETQGTLNIEYVYSNGNDVYITAAGDILDTRGNTDNSYPNVWGNDISLTSTSGTIGASGTDNDLDLYLNYNSSGGELTASASGDIYIDETQGTLNIEYVFSNGNDVYITSAGSILDGNQGITTAKITGNLISLTAGSDSDIGTDSTDAGLLEIYSGSSGLTADASAGTSGKIFIKQVGQDASLDSTDTLIVNSGNITADEEIYLHADWKIQNYYGGSGSTIVTTATTSDITLVTDDTKLYNEDPAEGSEYGGNVTTGSSGSVTFERTSSGSIWIGYDGGGADDPDNASHPDSGDTTYVTDDEIGTISTGTIININPPPTSGNIIIDNNYDFRNNPVNVGANTLYILRSTAGDLHIGDFDISDIDEDGYIHSTEIYDSGTAYIVADTIEFGNVLDPATYTYGETDEIYLYGTADDCADFSHNSSTGGRSNIRLVADTHIYERGDTENTYTDLIAKSITLESANGAIGEYKNSVGWYWLEIDTDATNGTLNANAAASETSGIMLNEISGALNIDTINKLPGESAVRNNVTIKADGNIVDVNDDDNANIYANTISLTSDSNIGSSSNLFDVDSGSSNTKPVQAYANNNGNIYIQETDGALYHNEIDAGTGTIYLYSDGDIQEYTYGGTSHFLIGGDITLVSEGAIGQISEYIPIKLSSGGHVSAETINNGNIYIENYYGGTYEEDLIIDKIDAGTGYVYLKAYENLVDTDSSDTINYDNITGNALYLYPGQTGPSTSYTIGTSSNKLRINCGISLYIANNSNGGVYLYSDDDLTINQVYSEGDIDISSTNGDLTIGILNANDGASGCDITLDAGGAITTTSQYPTINLVGYDVTLTSVDDIGSASYPIEIDAEGTVSVDASSGDEYYNER
ncbi:MAG: leukotoxin LktA family filamentous adhesin [Cyanobacteriota bacterium]